MRTARGSKFGKWGVWPEEHRDLPAPAQIYGRQPKIDSTIGDAPSWLKKTKVIVDMINDSKKIKADELPSDPAANNGYGLLRQVYTPARDQNEWEEKYWDGVKWMGLHDAIFHFGHPIGELVFENTEMVTHESAIENTPVSDGEGEQWVELPPVYG